MKTVKFLNNQLENEFQEKGYILIKNFLSLNDVEKIRKQYYNKHIDKLDDLMWNSLYHIPVSESIELSNYLLGIIKPKLEETFDDFKAPLATLMSKCALHPEGQDTPHRDYSVLDEKEYEYRQIWIPIVDITLNNGPMVVIPGSHKLNHKILPMMGACDFRAQEEKLKIEYGEPILMDAGDLLVYADRTIHAGLPNYSTHERPVVHFGIMPKEAKVRFYRENKEKNVVEVYEVDNDWYLKVRNFEELPNLNEKYIGSLSKDELQLV